MAVYLRFQLPPLHLSNVECVDHEMHGLLGVKGKRALTVITDLDVLSASPCFLPFLLLYCMLRKNEMNLG
jgi:hypothetical protein